MPNPPPFTVQPGEQILARRLPNGDSEATIFYAGVHYAAAVAAASRLKAAGSTPSPGDAIAAIMCAGAAAEAFVVENAVLAGACAANARINGNPRPKEELLASIMTDDDSAGRMPLPSRYSLSKLILTGSPYSSGASPLQDFIGLVRIRNALAHVKPSAVRDEAGQGAVWKFLTGKRLVSTTGSHPSLLSNLMTASVAAFACNAASAIIQDLGRSWNDQETGVSVLSVQPQSPGAQGDRLAAHFPAV